MKLTIISGVMGMLMFILFVGGLAQSISKNPAHGGIPFVIIVVFICSLALYGLYEEVKEQRENANRDR